MTSVQEKKRAAKKDKNKFASASAAKVPAMENVTKDENYVEKEVPELPSDNRAIM